MPNEEVLIFFNFLLQDRDGFMWFGTQAGLNCFDGYRNQVFGNEPDGPSSLVDNYVQAAYEGGRGRLWFGTRGGLARFDPAIRNFIRLPLQAGGEHDAPNSAVTATAGDGGDGLWIGTGAGIVHESNTPIGNSLLMASTLQEKTAALSDRFAHNTLGKSDLETWPGSHQLRQQRAAARVRRARRPHDPR